MSTDTEYTFDEAPEAMDPGAEHVETEVADETAAADGSADGPARSPQPKRGNQRPAIRRAVRKTLEVIEASPQVSDMAAGLLGVASDNTEGIVTAILTGDRRSQMQPVTDIRKVRESDEFEMGIVTSAMGRDRMREIWKLLSHLSQVKGNMPASEPKAALRIAKAVNSLDDEVLATLTEVDDLLKRG